MAEFKKGIISEEALEEIAGGLKISASTVKKVLAGAGVGILALSAASGIAGGGYLLYNKFKKSHNPVGGQQVPPAGEQQVTPAGEQQVTPAGKQQVTPAGEQQVPPAGGQLQ